MAKLRVGNMQDLDAAENGTAIYVGDLENVYIHLSGTFVGTIKFQVSTDLGTTWLEFESHTAAALSAKLPPCNKIRAICSAYTSGTAKLQYGGDVRA